MTAEEVVFMKRILSVLAACIAAVMLASFCGCAVPAANAEAQTAAGQTYQERLAFCREQIEALTDFRPEIVIVLGTGLGDYVNSLDVKMTIPYRDIQGWPVSTAPKHAGNLVFAEYKGLHLAVMQGRVHYYEGYSMEEVVLPLRVLHMLGADTVILSNAVGSMNPEFRVGEFVCIRDQISSFVPSPLIGGNNGEAESLFVGMTDAFDPAMQETVMKVGEENGIPVHSGVFLQVTGPQYETPAEIRMYRALGADTVAMSLAVEVLAARRMDMKVCGLSCVSNMAAGMEEEGFSHDTIEDSVHDALDHYRTLVNGLLDSLAEAP